MKPQPEYTFLKNPLFPSSGFLSVAATLFHSENPAFINGEVVLTALKYKSNKQSHTWPIDSVMKRVHLKYLLYSPFLKKKEPVKSQE